MADPDTVQGAFLAADNLSEPPALWNHAATIMGISISLIVITTICVALRLYTHLFITKRVGWDDFSVVLFLFTGYLGSIASCVSIRYGLGQHVIVVGLNKMEHWLETFYVINGSWQLSCMLVKLSLLLQYLRLYETGPMRILIKVLFGIVMAWGSAFAILAWFPCNPPSGYWRWTEDFQCWAFASPKISDFFMTYALQAASNMFFNLVIICIPLPKYLMHRAAINARTRWGLVGLFVSGGLVVAVSALRLYDIVLHKATTYPTFDPTWYGSSAVCLGLLEVNLAIICASVPIFWPALRKVMGQITVTQEVLVTRHSRYWTDDGDDVELQRPKSGGIRVGSVASRSSERPWWQIESPFNKPRGGGCCSDNDSAQQSIVTVHELQLVDSCTEKTEEDADAAAADKDKDKDGSTLAGTSHYNNPYILAQINPLEPIHSQYAFSSEATAELEPKRRKASCS